MTIEVKKTYKLFIGGKFPRSESGRTFEPADAAGFNVAQASRKDFRDAVVAARKATGAWQGMTGYNRGQILYRLAEMVTSRRASVIDEIRAGSKRTEAAARKEVDAAVRLLTFYAGLPDKLQQLLGSQNEVTGPFFNFSTVEPVGVVGIVAPSQPGFLGLLGLMAPVLAGGNTVVVLASEPAPLAALGLGELLAVSDVPGGVVNLLAGRHDELLPEFGKHRDLDGLLIAGPPLAAVSAAAAESVKRVRYADLSARDWSQADKLQNLHLVRPFVETKTFWHPVSP